MGDTDGIKINKIMVDPNDPHSFRVSEEDAARIRAMAMKNTEAGGYSPEMQDAMDKIKKRNESNRGVSNPSDLINNNDTNSIEMQNAMKQADAIVHGNGKPNIDISSVSTNGDINSPEMQKAMEQAKIMQNGGQSDNYDKLVSKDLHNQICIDQMQKKTAEYVKESTKFTDSIVKDNSTKEILDEAEASDRLSDFDFGEIDEFLNRLDELSFLEAVSYKKKLDIEIANWKSCGATLKAYNDLKLDDNVNRELMKSNAIDKYDFGFTIEEFEAHYDENLEKLEKISNKLISIITKNKDTMGSTQFMTDEMLHLVQNKIDKLSPDSPNYDYNKRRLEIIINAFNNRLELTYLSDKLAQYLDNNKITIKRAFKDSVPYLNKDQRSNAINELIRAFSENIVYELCVELMEAFDYDIDSVFVMVNFLAFIMKKENKSGRNVWAKVFILNMSDIFNDIFDIDEKDQTEDEAMYKYLIKVGDVFHEMIIDFINGNKIKEKINQDSTFGLNYHYAKKMSSIIDTEAIPSKE